MADYTILGHTASHCFWFVLFTLIQVTLQLLWVVVNAQGCIVQALKCHGCEVSSL